MMQWRTRILAGAVLAVLGAGTAVRLAAQPPAPATRSTSSGQAGSAQAKGLRVEISFTSAARAEPVTGMVYLAISKDNQSAPIQQTDPEGVPLFSKYVEQLKPGGRMVIPVGAPFLAQHLMLVEKRADGTILTRQILPVAFVPLTGKH
jgi:hypothetical protein